MMKRVACGMSGGVDSAVSAHILQQKGFQVTGVFMKNWDQTDETGNCSADADLADAQFVCQKLRMDLVEVNFVKEYWNNVFCDMVQSYETGFTPNPDVLCNKHIKFGAFFDFVKKSLGIDLVATGHYAQNSYGNFLEKSSAMQHVPAKLYMSKDRWKDQTLFLSQIPQHALQNTMFPIGDLYKAQVKNRAKEIGLDLIASKKESTGICFIGKRNFQNFIQEYVVPKEGKFVDVETGETVGFHRGTHYWTIGQRCSIPGLRTAYFVVKVDANSQDILVANSTHHPALYASEMYTTEPHWISEKPQAFDKLYRCQFKFQHIHQLQKCTLEKLPCGTVKVTTDHPIRALTPGQFSVFYQNDQCLGSAKILSIGQSLYDQGYSEEVILNLKYESQ